MKSECWACGDYAPMPLSGRHWCHGCESDYETRSRRHAETLEQLLKDIKD